MPRYKSTFGKGREAITFRRGAAREPQPLTERIRRTIDQRPDVTRSPEDLNRIIQICTTQCEKLGTARWGEVHSEGCPYHGRPCDGAFEKWMASLADVRTWCQHWGPEDGIFHQIETNLTQ